MIAKNLVSLKYIEFQHWPSFHVSSAIWEVNNSVLLKLSLCNLYSSLEYISKCIINDTHVTKYKCQVGIV